MSEKLYSVEATDGTIVSVPTETVSQLATLDFKSIAFLMIKPMILGWIEVTIRSTDLKTKLKLTDTQIDDLVKYLGAQVDKIINKVS